MKTLLIFSVLLLIFSCTKDKVKETPKSDIYGEWNYISTQHANSNTTVVLDQFSLNFTNDSIIGWGCSYVKTENKINAFFSESNHYETIYYFISGNELTLILNNGNKIFFHRE